MKDGCPFCDYEGPSPILSEGVPVEGHCGSEWFFVIEPLDPVTEGHLLVIPRRHVRSATADPELAGMAFSFAAGWALGYGIPSCNFITSCGSAATQTVEHLHVHIVPRREGDGLVLPWSHAVEFRSQQELALTRAMLRRSVRLDQDEGVESPIALGLLARLERLGS